ncbi:hypothetical protein, partial [Paraburkholderia kirstenboschensis]|uniref:hypothetical protein n=1 Tax=Paraburkholderia kirstenboschensis TaxID=1245436 RepID=UPI001FB1BBA1
MNQSGDRPYSSASLASASDGAASFAGANQLNVSSVGPWNVHSAAAARISFFGLVGFRASASASDAATDEAACDTLDAPEAEEPLEPDAAHAAEAEEADAAR